MRDPRHHQGPQRPRTKSHPCSSSTGLGTTAAIWALRHIIRRADRIVTWAYDRQVDLETGSRQ